jgi:hypothetical protein
MNLAVGLWSLKINCNHAIVKRVECGDSSPLLVSFLQTKSGEESPHSTRFAISAMTIMVAFIFQRP